MEDLQVVFSTNYKVWINRIIEILELYKKFYPEKYGNIDTNKTKSYVSKEKVIVAYQDKNFDNPVCEFPTDWLRLPDGEILFKILTENKRD
jgi:hypothetical protein